MEIGDHPRRILHAFIPMEVCRELEFIHKGNCTVGYRPNVFSTTLSHLIATNSSHLIMPFVSLRERLKEQVEQAFGCEYELFIEFTGLISWTKGSSIGWHSDDNRPYLKQRAFAAVCYLNSYEEDFSGGLFHFQDGEPATIIPKAGDVAIYSADSRNMHSVDEIKSGERLTLTLWFTRDASYDEDAKLISLLLAENISLENSSSSSLIPLPASSNMYWYSSLATESGEEVVEFDVRVMRLALLGYDVCPATQEGSRSNNGCCELERLDNEDVVLEKPLWLVRGDALLNVEFGNIMHALQVVEFYSWKKASMSGQEEEVGWTENYESRSIDIARCLSTVQRETSRQLKSGLMKDRWDVAKNVFRHCSAVYGKSNSSSSREYKEFSSDEGGVCDAVKGWEVYSLNLRKQLVMSLPVWQSHQSIFSIVPAEDVGVR